MATEARPLFHFYLRYLWNETDFGQFQTTLFGMLRDTVAAITTTSGAGVLSGGTVTAGVGLSVNVAAYLAIDSTGYLHVRNSQVSNVALTAADVTNPRKDLIVARKLLTDADDVTIPPATVPVKLHQLQDTQIVIITGTAAASPAYPAKVAGDVIIAGVTVAANASAPSNVDTSVKETFAIPSILSASVQKTFYRSRVLHWFNGGGSASAFGTIPYNQARGIFANGKYLQFTQTGIAYSTDALVWTNVSLSLSGGSIRGQIVWNGVIYVACADDGTTAKIWSSPDGVTWTVRQTLTSAGAHYANVFWDGTNFIASANGGQLYTSTNGTSWTSQTSGFSSTDIADGAVSVGGVRVLVGGSGKTSFSANGTSWTANSAISGAPLVFRVWWSTLTSEFIALAQSGKLYSSPDGQTWTLRTSGFTTGGGDFGTVWANNASIMVAGDDSGTEARLVWSTDGHTWTSAISPGGVAAGKTNGLVWDGYVFIAAGTYGVMVSVDGKNWTAATGATSEGNTILLDPTTLTAVIPVAGAATSYTTANALAA